MTGQQLLTFHPRGKLAYAFLGVHLVGVASDTGRWMFALDGNVTWRRSAGDLAAAKASLSEYARQWYDALHQPLVADQAERLCDTPQILRPKRELKIAIIDPEAIALRLKQAGVVTTYAMPPVVDGVEAAPATLAQARMYCVSAEASAEARLRAAPADRLAEHELAVFGGLVRLIDACSGSGVIKAELQRIARERLEAERLSAAKVDDDQKSGKTDLESTRVEVETDPAGDEAKASA